MRQYKKYWRALLALVLFFGGYWLLFYRKGHNKIEDAPAPKVKVAVDLSPIDFGISSSGNMEGLQYDLLSLLLPDTTVQWIPFTSRREALEALAKREVDLYATSFAWSTNETIESVATTSPLYVSGFALVHAVDSTDRSWSEVFAESEHIPIYIPLEAHDIRVLLENLQDLSYPEIEIVDSEESAESLCLAVARGDIPYTICNRDIARQIRDRIGGIIVEESIAFDLHQVWVLRNDDANLLELLNRRIDEYKETYTWSEILKKYGMKAHQIP